MGRSRTVDGSPRSVVVVPDIPDEELNVPIRQVYHPPYLDEPSCLSVSTPPRKVAQSADSDVSLSATDVNFFVKALKRVAKDDFSDLIHSIKKKQEPDFQCLSRRQTNAERPSVHVETVGENVDLEEEEAEDQGLGNEKSIASLTVAMARGKIPSREMLEKRPETSSKSPDPLSQPVKLYKRGIKNSILETEDDDGDGSYISESSEEEETPLQKFISKSLSRSSSMMGKKSLRRPNPDEGDAALQMTRKISFSGEDRVRLYDLTTDEIEQKRLNEEDDILLEARRRRQRRKMPGVFCVSGPHVNEASAMLAEWYQGGVQTAKVSEENFFSCSLGIAIYGRRQLTVCLACCGQGIHKKCEEKGWLKDVDGLLKYFSRSSSEKEHEGNVHFCGVTPSDPEPKEDHVRLATLAPIVHASESKEGLQLASGRTSSSAGHTRQNLSQPTRSIASPMFKQSDWMDKMPENPFQEHRKIGSIVKIASLSFDSHAPSDEASGTVDEIMTPTRQQKSRGMNHIHLLEIAENGEEDGQEITRFEC